jgi:hypothetical protein
MTEIKSFEGVTFNGQEIAVVSNWVCACSGGHPVGEPDAKCYRKGGFMADSLIAGDRVVAETMDYYGDMEWLDAPRRIWVNGPGYVESVDEVLALL